jgi:predicted PurR-regulated permease PerM
MQKYTHHLPHYISLFGILAAGAIAFALFNYDRTLQVSVAIAVAFAYIAWGLVHHYLHRDLYVEVMIEYIVVAALGLVILFSLIFRV